MQSVVMKFGVIDYTFLEELCLLGMDQLKYW